MNRVRLRDAYHDQNVRDIYATPYDSYRWPAHRIRANVTVAFAEAMTKRYPIVRSLADLSAGDASISGKIARYAAHYLGDITDRGYQFHGPIEETLLFVPTVDLFVCTETIEHLDEPDFVLQLIRNRTSKLLLSTPIDAWDDFKNPEHYWAWDRPAVESMLGLAGFTSVAYTELDLRNMEDGEYCFGIWWAQ